MERAGEAHLTAEPWATALSWLTVMLRARLRGRAAIRGRGLRAWPGSIPSRFQWENAVAVSHPEEPWER